MNSMNETSIEEVLDQALDLVSEDLDRRSIEVDRSGAAPVPAVPADPDLLVQALHELLTNAAEALIEGGHIRLRTGADGDCVFVEVADDGPGIEPDIVENIYEPFYTTKQGSTGLGLYMILRIMKAHGGRLELLPDAGAGPHGTGTCFRMHLPMKGSSDGGNGARTRSS